MMKSGWLLLPAAVLGIASVIVLINGMSLPEGSPKIISGSIILWGGIISYIVLMAITYYQLNRPVTTELFLIVGWCMLAMNEINALYGLSSITQVCAWILIIVALAATAVSLVCYVKYYGLSVQAGYWDGMVPLIMAGVYMGILSVVLFI